MVSIDYIMDLLDWGNSDEMQKEGLKLADSIKCISVFLQPGSPYGKNVWDNCAKVFAQKSDDELKPHMIGLLEWLQDMNWPGAFIILERLQNYADAYELHMYLDICVKKATMLGDTTWAKNLSILRR